MKRVSRLAVINLKAKTEKSKRRKILFVTEVSHLLLPDEFERKDNFHTVGEKKTPTFSV